MVIDDLNPAETELWNAFPSGRAVDLSMDDAPTVGDKGEPRTESISTIRAEVLMALLTGGRESEPGQVAAVQLNGAHITGTLNLGHAVITVPFALTNCRFDEPLYLHWARLQEVQLLDCTLPSLIASGARVDGHLWLEGCRISHGLQLDGAHITGLLYLNGAHLANPSGEALLGDRMTVDGNVYCGMRERRPGLRTAFLAEGEVRLPRADIGGQLIMRGAVLRNPGKIALYASRVQVGANAFFDGGFTAQGEIRLRGARVGGYLSMAGAVLTNPGGPTLNANDLTIDTDVYCYNGFTSIGKVSFDGATIGGELSFDTAYLSWNRPRAEQPHADPNTADAALSLQRLEAEEVDLRTAGPIDGVLELQYAEIGVLRDEEASWPARMQLDGLHYGNLNPPLTAPERLRWLRKDTDGYAPQPYDRLAQTYTLLGLDREAREVLLSKQRDRNATSRSPAVKLWGWVQDITVGYGYKPLRALTWLIILQVTGTVIFQLYQPPILNVQGMGAGTNHYPTYNSFLFTLNQLLPVGNFNQQNLFAPHGIFLWIADIISALGLVLGLTVFAGVARVLSRD